MPWGNRTGPMGYGPMTGRRAGYCSGYNRPGYMNPVSGPGYYSRDYGRGLGGGWGRRGGFGLGFWGIGRRFVRRIGFWGRGIGYGRRRW